MAKKLHRDKNGNITKTPSRQSIDQKRQFNLLKKFNNCNILGGLSSRSQYLFGGALYSREQTKIKNIGIFGRNLKDIDAIIEENGIKFPIFCRYIGMNGGAQDNAFNNILDFIDQCPDIDDAEQIYPVIICGGGYFHRKRHEYHNYQVNFPLPAIFTALQVLKIIIISKKKRCAVFDESTLQGYLLAADVNPNISDLLDINIADEE